MRWISPGSSWWLSLFFLLVSLGSAVAQTTPIRGNRVIDGHINWCDDDNLDANANTYVCTLGASLSAYRLGTAYTFRAATTNTGTATLNLNSLGARTLVKAQGSITTPLVAGDICPDQMVTVMYDGVNMQLLTPPCRPVAVTIASGATALATAAIASGACATTQTVTATGVLTTDAIIASFNADVSAVTGYAPLTTGTLRVDVFPTANTVNLKVCNGTLSSITPGAVTLNWRIVR